jgi:hypothetical protein
MPLEERFVDSYILHTYDIALTLVDNLVDEKHRIAVRQVFANLVNIHQRRHRRIIQG